MSINSISPIDGRYQRKTELLGKYFSEKALIKYRILVEISYLKHLIKLEELNIRELSDKENKLLEDLVLISGQDAEIVKAIETKGYQDIPATNHDVKAVEYFIKLKLENTSLKDLLEMVHFALTSEDINNLAYALMLRDSLNEAILPKVAQLYEILYQLALENKECAMLARTHGQPASPTTFGKEILIFVNRLKDELKTLADIKIMAKLNGATGNYNAHYVTFTTIDWEKFSLTLIDNFNSTINMSEISPYFKNVRIKLQSNKVTPQIEPHDSYTRIFDSIKRLNSILIDFSQDIWRYISDGWIRQKAVKGEIGSSAMPHKVNPIDFENSEGNLGIANALFNFFSGKLPISRLQRDLSDSTVLRNCGVAFAHSFISYQSLIKGLAKIAVNKEKIQKNLQQTPEVIAEAYQNILRSAGVAKPYELLKEVTRGKEIKLSDFHQLVNKLDLTAELKERLLKIRPDNYTGIAAKIVSEFDPSIK